MQEETALDSWSGDLVSISSYTPKILEVRKKLKRGLRNLLVSSPTTLSSEI